MPTTMLAPASGSAVARSAVGARGCSSRAAAFVSSKPLRTATTTTTTTPAVFSRGCSQRSRRPLVPRASGVDPESLAILQQRLGQRIELEGDGAARLNQTAGQLLGADGRAIDRDERKKVLKVRGARIP